MRTNKHEEQWAALDEAEAEARRFLRRAKAWRSETSEYEMPGEKKPRLVPKKSNTAAVKRASMDLTRALAQVRKPRYPWAEE